jgi:hypothetical protein
MSWDLFLRKGGTHLATSVTRRLWKGLHDGFKLSHRIGQNEQCRLRGINSVSGMGRRKYLSVARHKPAWANTPTISVAGLLNTR